VKFSFGIVAAPGADLCRDRFATNIAGIAMANWKGSSRGEPLRQKPPDTDAGHHP
jgi:hypothetical protein